MGAVFNITIDQGADFQRVIHIKDDTGLSQDLTGYSFRGQGREAYGVPGDPAFTFTFAIKNQTTDKGKVTWTLPGAALSALVLRAEKKFVYDIDMVAPGGAVTRLFKGTATVLPGVTKA